MITTLEALNTIAEKHGYQNWIHAGILKEPAELTTLVTEAMEYYAELSNSHKHGVMQVPPTESEIRAQALAMENPNDGYATKIIARAAYESGARWAISKMSSGTAVGQRSVGTNAARWLSKHVCGAQGFNPMLGDICEGCETERKSSEGHL